MHNDGSYEDSVGKPRLYYIDQSEALQNLIDFIDLNFVNK